MNATPTTERPFTLARLPPQVVRQRSLENLMRMGHCAPTIMQTLLDLAGADAPWLVRLVGGLPGGIGNSGNECGGITAPLVVLGLRHARDPAIDGVPAVIARGRALLEVFRASHGTTACRDILGHARLPLGCVRVVRLAPERCLELDASPCPDASTECRAACARLHAHLAAREFHCAASVLRLARDPEPVERPLLDAAAAFEGGTVHAGLTCGALVAGVLLLGLAHARIERSRPRVLRMLATMAVRGDAFAEELNGFNRAMNQGHALVAWFVAAFGSTQCRALTGCDFSTVAGVRRFAESDGLDRCEGIARAVAAKARAMAERAGAAAPFRHLDGAAATGAV